MNPWLDTGGVLLLGVGGIGLAMGCLRLRGAWWWVGYAIPLLGIGLLWLDGLLPPGQSFPGMSWLTSGRAGYASSGLFVGWLFSTLIGRLQKRRLRWLVGVLAALAFIQHSLLPFAAHAWVHDYLAGLRTNLDSDGVCIQSNHYTCGPAAAVTALRRLGFPAEESQVALLAHTNPVQGTPTDILADALRRHYGPQGLSCEFRRFKSIEELRHGGVTLAVVKYSPTMDHLVAVLEVPDNKVVVGDPLLGRVVMTRTAFLNRWRFLGVELKR
ncbi:MAG: hypothetical protein HZA91_11715 [Verrucomicrobia bacterium]|nr:hypothetical protein [Verrucomicrobiota bacterium]